MKKYKIVLIYAVIFFFQPFFGSIAPFFNLPDLILCITLMHILIGKEEETPAFLICAAVFSLLVDICFYQFWGISVISLLAAVGVALIFKRLINNENILMVTAAMIAVSMTYNFCYWLISFILGSPFGFVYMFRHAALIIIADIVVCQIIYFMRIGEIIQARRDRYFR